MTDIIRFGRTAFACGTNGGRRGGSEETEELEIVMGSVRGR